MGSPVVVASPRKSPSYNRRANKPLVEKKRRARINGCLGQLKSLILGAMQTEGAQVSRLEKADILEMTVKYLQHIQHQRVVATEPEVVTKFSAGYTECASEVIRYIEAVKCVTPDVKASLENHLVERLRGSVPQALTHNQVPPLASHRNSNPSSQPLNSVPQHLTSVQQHLNSAPQFSQPRSFTSPKNMSLSSSDIYMKPNAAKEGILTHVKEIDIANKAAAEALKRPHRVSSSLTPRVSVSSIKQTAQAAPVSPKSVSPKTEILGGEELFNELRARHESGVSHVLHPTPRLARSQSTSPPHARRGDDATRPPTDTYAGDRERHNSSEPALHVSSHYTHAMAYSHQAYPPTAYGHEVCISSNIDHQRDVNTMKSEKETYCSEYERPLHIHIPDSPRVPPTPSPPFYPSGMSYHPCHPHETNAPVSPSNYSVPSLDNSPPTILYGYSQRTPSPFYKMETEESARFTQNSSSIQYSEYALEPSQVSYKSTNSGYANDLRAVGAVPATPSPPTLTREEPFPTHISQRNRTGNYCQDNFGNEQPPSSMSAMQTQHCYVQELEQFTAAHTPENVYMEYQSQASGHFYKDVQSCDQPDVKRQQQQQPRSEVTSPQQNSGSHQSSIACIPRVSTPQASEANTKNPHNEQSAVNGPAPQTSALSRQKDTPLSLFTLKRRILDGLGSEGEWTASGKKSRQQEQTTSAQVNWNKTDERETTLPCKEKDFMSAGEIMCKVSAHCAADDSLWRPW